MSSQVKSGGSGGGVMHMCGYKESQAVSFTSSSSSCAVGDGSFSFVSFGSCTNIACSAATMACFTSYPVVNSADAATSAFYD
jgi:hypothetical protein